MQVRTQIKQEFILKVLRSNGGDVKAACSATKVGRTQFYHWQKNQVEFRKSVEDVYRKIEAFTKSTVYLSALKKDPEAAKILMLRMKQKLNKK